MSELSYISVRLTSILFGLFSQFNDISTFVGYFMLKPSLQKNSSATTLPIAGGLGGSHLSQRY